MYLIAVCVKIVIEMYFKYIEKNNNLMKSNYNKNYSFELINPYHYPFKRYRLPISNAIGQLTNLDPSGTFHGGGTF